MVREQVRVLAVYVAHDDDEDEDAAAVDLGAALNGFDDEDIPLMSDSLLLLPVDCGGLLRAALVLVEAAEGW